MLMKLSCRCSRRSVLHMVGVALLLVSIGASATNYNWRVSITPKGGGEVQWTSSQPQQDGKLTTGGSITVAEGGYLDLTFTPAAGYRLDVVVKNTEIITPYLDMYNHYQFGPISNSHNIAVKFVAINPTGSFDLKPPAVLPVGVAPIYNATGHYSGIVPDSVPLVKGKAFDADVAMDESGKLDILPNSLEGFTPSTTGNKPIVGSLKTVNNQPQVKVSASFKGTLDGIGGEGSGSATLSGVQATAPVAALPFQIKTTNLGAEQTLDAAGSGVYKVALKNTDTGAKTTFKSNENVDVSVPVTTNAGKDWAVNISLSQHTDKKNKLQTYASATLTLPTGDNVAFTERMVKYSIKQGYNLAFSKGINQTSTVLDKKTKLSVNKMLFNCPSAQSCQLTGGQLQYSFLGQKGKANLMDFVSQ